MTSGCDQVCWLLVVPTTHTHSFPISTTASRLQCTLGFAGGKTLPPKAVFGQEDAMWLGGADRDASSAAGEAHFDPSGAPIPAGGVRGVPLLHFAILTPTAWTVSKDWSILCARCCLYCKSLREI